MRLFRSSEHRRAAVVALAILTLSAACGDEVVVNPVFGERCSAGDLRIGTPISGALSEESPCIEDRHFWTGYRSAYDAYSVRLEAGKAYLFRLERRPDPKHDGRNGLDAVLSVFGRDEHGVVRPLALSDQEGGENDAELFFVPTRTATYSIVAGMYGDLLDPQDLGGYLLSSGECPIVGTVAGNGTRDFTLQPSGCVRTRAGNGAAPATYRFVTIDAAPNQRVTVAVEADDFQPAWELFGPEHDVFENLYDESDYAYAVGNAERTIDVGPAGGRVTLAIGRLGGEGDEFEVTVTRTALGAIAPAASKALKRAPLRRP